MGLDDLIDENSEGRYKEGNVSSRMDPETLSLDRFGWTWIIAHQPEAATTIARKTSQEGAKLVISIIDDLLEDDVPGLEVRDSSKESYRKIRQNIIDRKL